MGVSTKLHVVCDESPNKIVKCFTDFLSQKEETMNKEGNAVLKSKFSNSTNWKKNKYFDSQLNKTLFTNNYMATYFDFEDLKGHSYSPQIFIVTDKDLMLKETDYFEFKEVLNKDKNTVGISFGSRSESIELLNNFFDFLKQAYPNIAISLDYNDCDEIVERYYENGKEYKIDRYNETKEEVKNKLLNKIEEKVQKIEENHKQQYKKKS